VHPANPFTFDGLGVWIASLLTLFIFSFLYKDNPFYKLAEHLFVGISAGYYVMQEWWAVIYPQCVKPLMHGEKPLMIIPGILGLFLFSRFIPKAGWLSRWSLAIIIGAYAGIKTTGFAQGDLVAQFQASILPVWVPGHLGASINNVLFLAGLLSTLVFFFFSTEHKGAIKHTAQLGVWFLMVSFGAAYGFTVMARVSLLIGRFQYLLDPWLGVTRF
jgi:hypothetical protein